MYFPFQARAAEVPLTKPNLSASICSMMANFYGVSVGLATALGREGGLAMDEERTQDLYFRVLHVVAGFGCDIKESLPYDAFAALHSVGEIVETVAAVLSL